jgi:hypothetical protein
MSIDLHCLLRGSFAYTFKYCISPSTVLPSGWTRGGGGNLKGNRGTNITNCTLTHAENKTDNAAEEESNLYQRILMCYYPASVVPPLLRE